MFKFCYFSVIILLPFPAEEKDRYPVKLIQHFIYQSNIACGNILEVKDAHSTEKDELFDYFKILAKGFSLFTVLKFENRLKNTWRCPTTLNVVMGWHQGVQEKLIEISNVEKISGAIWLIFLPPNTTSYEYLSRMNIPFNAEFFITARTESEEIILERSYKVDFKYPLRVSRYGIWHRTLNIITDFSDDYVYNQRNDLEGFPIRVSTKEDYPISTLTKLKEDEFQIGGYFGFVLSELADQLNFKKMFVRPEKNSTGSPNVNGTWNGLIGMLQRNEIDLSIAPQVIDKKLIPVASFLKPLLRTNFQIFFKHDGNSIDWLVIFKPFDTYVWLCIILWILISSLTMDRFYNIETKLNNEKGSCKKEFTKFNVVFNNLAALCQQGVATPESHSCRNLFFMTFILSTVLVAAYSAVLISNLANFQPSRPFSSLETFPKDGSYKLVAIGESTDYAYFSESNDSLRKEIFEKAVKTAPESQYIFTKEQGLDVICKRKKYALFIVFDIPKITAQKYSDNENLNCQILYLKTPLDVVFLSIFRRRNLPYAEIINQLLLKMEIRGILKKLRNQAWPLEQIKKNSGYTPVNVHHVSFIYCILLFGIIISALILAAELYFDRRRRKL